MNNRRLIRKLTMNLSEKDVCSNQLGSDSKSLLHVHCNPKRPHCSFFQHICSCVPPREKKIGNIKLSYFLFFKSNIYEQVWFAVQNNILNKKNTIFDSFLLIAKSMELDVNRFSPGNISTKVGHWYFFKTTTICK